MFGLLKKLLRKPAAPPVVPAGSGPMGSMLAASTPSMPRRVEAGPGQVHRNGHHNGGSGKGVEVSLQTVLTNLPLELQSRVLQTEVNGLKLVVPLEKVLAQLAKGTVRVSFGELRQAFPNVFAGPADLDRLMVPLPLAEILSSINPALIQRRRVQRQIEVPAEISSPFDERHLGLNVQVGGAKTDTESIAASGLASLPSAPAPAFIRQTTVPIPQAPIAPARSNLTAAPTPPPPAAIPLPAAPLRPLPRPSVNSKPAAPPPRTSAPPAVPLPPPPPLAVVPPPTPAPALEPKVQEPPTPVIAPEAATPAPAPEPAAPMQTRSETGWLEVNLVALADVWPDGVRKEIVQSGLVDAKVHLPAELIERALKQGRIAFTWRMLRSWIRPQRQTAPSGNDGALLELPLKIVAPMFLSRQSDAAKAHHKVQVDDDIPNLFFGFPQPESAAAAAAATAKPADTNYYVWDDLGDKARVTEADTKRGPSAGTRFLSKYATPNEIVSRAAALDGVAGALIALPDGLLVASQLPTGMNADTLAAFLPQIFGKVSACTKELRMGELNNLNFTVGNVPWKIFRVNAIFFAAFGRMGEPLPTATLAALAAELDHKPK